MFSNLLFLKAVIEYIKEIINNIKTKEIKSFLIDDNQSNYSLYNEYNSQMIYSTKYFLKQKDSNYNYIVELRRLNGFESFIYKVYKEENNKQTITKDRKISKKEFNKLINDYEIIKVINTKEIYFMYNMERYKLCFYNDKTILEIENNNLNNSLIIPDNLKLVNKEKNRCRKRSLNNGYI